MTSRATAELDDLVDSYVQVAAAQDSLAGGELSLSKADIERSDRIMAGSTVLVGPDEELPTRGRQRRPSRTLSSGLRMALDFRRLRNAER